MYLLLEAVAIVDALQIDGLAVWTPAIERTIAVEAQRFWLFSLVCGVVGGLLRMLKVYLYTPLPSIKNTGEELEEDKIVTVWADFDVRREQQRLKRLFLRRKRSRVLWIREMRAKMRGLGRCVLACSIDVLLPGSAIGWIDVSSGTVGVAMLITTVLTGLDVWERCGGEVAGGA
jgi:hypothetical protein